MSVFTPFEALHRETSTPTSEPAASFVRSVRVGRESRFALQPKPLDEARAYLDTVSRQWDDALSRLKAFVEE